MRILRKIFLKSFKELTGWLLNIQNKYQLLLDLPFNSKVFQLGVGHYCVFSNIQS